MRKKIGYLVVIALGLAASVAACSEKEDEAGAATGRVTHPIDDKLPHRTINPVLVKKENSCEEIPRTEYAEHIRQYVNGKAELKKLDLAVSGHKGVEIRSLGEDRLVILDRRQNVLWHYDLREDRADEVASPGTGPGELNFAVDLATNGSDVYVAGADMRIGAFFCASASCQYSETIRTGFQLRGLASRKDGWFVATGLIPMSRDRRRLEKLDGALQVLDAEGEIAESFGEMYDTDVWLVKSYYTRGENIDYNKEINKYSLSFQSLPYIYLYDGKGSIKRRYKIKAYTQPFIDYDPEAQRRGVPDQEDFSELVEVRFLRDGALLATVKTRLRSSPKTTEHKTHYKFDYYLLKPSVGCTTFLGSDENVTPHGGEIVVTDDHVLKVQEGNVYKIQ